MPADTGAPADVAVAERGPARRACVVLLGGRPFAVDVAEAREVVVVDSTTPVPGAPAPLVGVMNLRGNVLPVVEARPLLGLTTRTPDGPARALVIADGERRAAILIERVLGLATFDEIQPLPDGETDASALTLGELAAESTGPARVLDAGALLAALRRAWETGG